MKLLFSAVVAALATVVSAQGSDVNILRFRVVGGPSGLNGAYISLKGGVAGVYGGGPVEQAALLYVGALKDSSTPVDVGICPMGIVRHSLVLTGPPGLLTAQDMYNPAGTSIPAGNTLTWGQWKFSDAGSGTTISSSGGTGSSISSSGTGGGSTTINRRRDTARNARRQSIITSSVPNQVTYTGSGKWVAFPTGANGADWKLAWFNPTPGTFTTQDYVSVNIVYERVTGNPSLICPL